MEQVSGADITSNTNDQGNNHSVHATQKQRESPTHFNFRNINKILKNILHFKIQIKCQNIV